MKDLKPPVFATLGCRLNAYETEAMREMAETAGLQGAVIVNTCAVTAEAVRKARQEIRRLARENPGAPDSSAGAPRRCDREQRRHPAVQVQEEHWRESTYRCRCRRQYPGCDLAGSRLTLRVAPRPIRSACAHHGERGEIRSRRVP